MKSAFELKQSLDKELDELIAKTRRTLMSWDRKSAIIDSLQAAKSTVNA